MPDEESSAGTKEGGLWLCLTSSLPVTFSISLFFCFPLSLLYDSESVLHIHSCITNYIEQHTK